MTIREFYTAIGSEYAEVEKRLGSEQLILHFVLKFLNDDTVSRLETAYAERNAADAFRAAHTLKGICANLGFGVLYDTAYQLTEALRGGSMDGSDPLYEKTVAEYVRVLTAVKQLAGD